jgi:hypothetical protein
MNENPRLLKLNLWTVWKGKKISSLRTLVCRPIGLLYEVEETRNVPECDVEIAVACNENGAH